jgi:fatty acid desaturase
MLSKPFFRSSPVDALPALGGVANVALIFWTFLCFASLPAWALAILFVVVAWCYCWNLQCVSHNFIHNPFFRSGWLNRAYSVLNSLAIGVPQVFYHHYHMNHHFGDNDKKGPDGSTKDWSSIYRHSTTDGPEPFWRYILLGYFRVEVGPLLRKVAARGWSEIVQAAVECLAIGGFFVTMALVDWRYFVFFYVPSHYLGWVLSYAEGYLEHYGCKPGNPYANSVSSYNRLYNLVWFNNGYHQEHHWDPKWHWSRMPELSERLQPELEANGTRILRGPHMTALLEDWLMGRHVHDSEPAQPPSQADTPNRRAA